MSQAQFSKAIWISLCLWVGVAILALCLGAAHGVSLDWILQLRLPRVILASAIGMGLAVAGVSLQALFSNPLCEPYLLGVSSGSALGSLIGFSLGFHWSLGGWDIASGLGGVLFVILLLFFMERVHQNHSSLILIGVMLGFFGNSAVILWISLTHPQGAYAALNWLFGDLSRAQNSGAVLTWGVCALLILKIQGYSTELDALLLGEQRASLLGVQVKKLRKSIVILSSLLVGFCVSAGGMIGFVGLMVPHFVRRWVGVTHLRVIPLSALWGAIMLILADTLSRVVVRPYELPVGVVTALLGSPLFLYLAMKARRMSG